jgi:hypothetical protein
MKIFSPILKGTTTVAQGTTNLSGSFTGSLFGTAATASYADNFTVGGTLTAQTINVQIITSSIEFNTGSTRNGALSTNTHEFTGSILITGSLNVNKGVITLPDSIHTSAQINFRNVTSEAELFKFPAANNTITKYGATDKLYYKTDKSVSNQNILAMTTDANVGIGTISPLYRTHIAATGSNVYLGISNQGTDNGHRTLRIGFGGNGANTFAELQGTRLNIADDINIIMQAGGGNVGIGTSSPLAKLTVDAGGTSSTMATFSIKHGNTGFEYANMSLANDPYHGLVLRGFPSVAGDYSVTANDTMAFYEYGADFRFYKKQPGILTQQVRFTEGVIYATNTSVQSISDIRTKENITNSEQGLDVITALRPVRFDFKEEFNEGRKNQLGFIAQEVEEIFPDAVGEWKDDNDGITYKTVGPGALIPVLVKAIQELKSENDTLKEILQRNNIQ